MNSAVALVQGAAGAGPGRGAGRGIRTHGGYCSLLVRESWLKRTLSKIGYSLVFGLAGDRRLLKRTEHREFGEIGVSQYLSGVASLHSDRWEIADITAKPR